MTRPHVLQRRVVCAQSARQRRFSGRAIPKITCSRLADPRSPFCPCFTQSHVCVRRCPPPPHRHRAVVLLWLVSMPEAWLPPTLPIASAQASPSLTSACSSSAAAAAAYPSCLSPNYYCKNASADWPVGRALRPQRTALRFGNGVPPAARTLASLPLTPLDPGSVQTAACLSRLGGRPRAPTPRWAQRSGRRTPTPASR